MVELWGWVGVGLTKCLRKSGVSVHGLHSVQSTLVRYRSQRIVAFLTELGNKEESGRGWVRYGPKAVSLVTYFKLSPAS